MGPFGLAYARLVEHGYAVLPIMPGTKKPGLPCNNNGGWMDFPGWTTFRPTLVHFKLWALSSAGIAILTGPRSGDVIALDNDSNDPRIAEALRSVLPDTPARKKGAKGDTGFYYGPGIPSHAWVINGRKVVEILGAGRQTVLPPTIHPDLGEPYRWTGSKTLEELRPEDLPLLPPDIIEQIDAVLAPFGYVPPEPRERASYDECDVADDPHRRLNEAALANLSAWVPALDLYRCRPYRHGFEAVAKWRPSTEGRKNEDRRRNLKIMPNGIKDFGANQGYTAIDLVMAACKCDLETAFAFLDGRLGWSGGDPLLDISALTASAPKLETLGLEPDDDNSNGNPNGSSNGNFNGNGAGNTGTHTGAHNGSTHNGSRESAQVIPLFKPTTRGPFSDWRTCSGAGKPESSSGSSESSAGTSTNDPLLESLTHDVPGVVGETTDWIVANAYRPNRVLALAAAVTVVGTLIGRRAMGPTGNATHLYVAAVAPASRGKEWPRKAIPMLLKAAGAGSHVCLSDIASQQAMNKVLTRMPLCAVVRDEIVSFLSRLTNPRSSSWEQSLLDMLCTLWSTGFDQFDTTITASTDAVIVQSPAISLFGTATPAKFWPVLQGAQVSNGLFSRYLAFESNVRPDAQKIPVPVTVPAALKDDLAELYRFGREPVSLAQLNDPNIEFEPQVLPWANDEAEEVYWKLDKWTKREIDNDPGQEEYLGRVPEQAVRLATNRAAGRAGHRAKVDTADMTWGADLASILVTNAMNQAQASLPQPRAASLPRILLTLSANAAW
jgi:hypothetical protein